MLGIMSTKMLSLSINNVTTFINSENCGFPDDELVRVRTRAPAVPRMGNNGIPHSRLIVVRDPGSKL